MGKVLASAGWIAAAGLAVAWWLPADRMKFPRLPWSGPSGADISEHFRSMQHHDRRLPAALPVVAKPAEVGRRAIAARPSPAENAPQRAAHSQAVPLPAGRPDPISRLIRHRMTSNQPQLHRKPSFPTPPAAIPLQANAAPAPREVAADHSLFFDAPRPPAPLPGVGGHRLP